VQAMGATVTLRAAWSAEPSNRAVARASRIITACRAHVAPAAFGTVAGAASSANAAHAKRSKATVTDAEAARSAAARSSPRSADAVNLARGNGEP
jgi:hypothetical protein